MSRTRLSLAASIASLTMVLAFGFMSTWSPAQVTAQESQPHTACDFLATQLSQARPRASVSGFPHQKIVVDCLSQVGPADAYSSTVALESTASRRTSHLPQDLGQSVGYLLSYATALNDSGETVGAGYNSDFALRALRWTPDGEIIDLGTMGGLNSEAVAINESGSVAGHADTSQGETHAFLWTEKDGMTDLGTMGGSASYVTAMNDSDQVVGASLRFGAPMVDVLGIAAEWHAFVWTKEQGMVDLGALGGTYSVARDINNVGQVVGQYGVGAQYRPFLWSAQDGMVDLGTLGGRSSEATAINEAGQIVGTSETADGRYHAFLWTAQDGMVDLGALGGRNSFATAINEAGQVVGTSDTVTGRSHAFMWSEETGMVDLDWPTAYSEALAINDAGQVVGITYSNSYEVDAFLWSEDGDMVLLNHLNNGLPNSGYPYFNYASAINERGQAAGYASFVSFFVHATLWNEPAEHQHIPHLRR